MFPGGWLASVYPTWLTIGSNELSCRTSPQLPKIRPPNGGHGVGMCCVRARMVRSCTVTPCLFLEKAAVLGGPESVIRG